MVNMWILTYNIYCDTVLTVRFRRQHEQLRQVIVRVLRPAVSSVSAGTSESQPAAEPLLIEPADNNSIEVCILCSLRCCILNMKSMWSIFVFIVLYIFTQHIVRFVLNYRR